MNRLIKVCGMRDGANIRDVEALGIDLMGFIFFAKSPRNVTTRPAYLPSECRRVGVFVNEQEAIIKERIEEFELDFVQLHGNESSEVCQSIAECGVGVIKAISIATVADIAVATKYDGVCDMLLFDTKCDGHGGSGERFDWSILDSYDGETPFMLSGGIDLGSADELKALTHPQLAGYDINSRFERSAADKDIELIKCFLEKIK